MAERPSSLQHAFCNDILKYWTSYFWPTIQFRGKLSVTRFWNKKTIFPKTAQKYLATAGLLKKWCQPKKFQIFGLLLNLIWGKDLSKIAQSGLTGVQYAIKFFHCNEWSSIVFQFISGISCVRLSHSTPSPSSLYSVTSKGEVVVFDPEAAEKSGNVQKTKVTRSLTFCFIVFYDLWYAQLVTTYFGLNTGPNFVVLNILVNFCNFLHYYHT